MPEDNKFEQAANDLKDKALVTIEEYEQNSDSSDDRFFKEAKDKIKQIYESLKDAIQDLSDKEEIKQVFEKANNKAQDVIDVLKNQTMKLSQNEKLNDTVQAGKVFVNDAADLVADVFKSGYESARKNEKIRSVMDTAEEKLNDLQEDERIKEALNKAEETVNKVGASMSDSLRKIFDKKGGE